MIVIQLMGGLGNQLQQYALYRKFISLNVPAAIDISWFEEKNQADMLAKRKIELKLLEGSDFKVATKEEISELKGGDDFFGKVRRKLLKSSVREYEENIIYDPKVLQFTDMYIRGYFACELYYHDILKSLRNELKFPVERSENSETINKISVDMQKSNSVSVHIRRGDYLDTVNAEMFGGICTDEYYKAAIAYCNEHIDNPKYFIFSDDTDYAREFADGCPNATVIDVNHADESFFDIYLMSMCKHNITANSTFSFWGARFNSNEAAIKIRPTKHKNSQTFDAEKMPVWWPGWKFISPEGVFYE